MTAFRLGLSPVRTELAVLGERMSSLAEVRQSIDRLEERTEVLQRDALSNPDQRLFART